MQREYSRKLLLALEDLRLGTMYDSKLAICLGVQGALIGKARGILGIPRFDVFSVVTDEEILAQPDLGDVSDRIISTRLDLPPSRVQRVRAKNGIESTAGGNHGVDHRHREPPNEVAQMMRGWRR